MHRFAIIAPTLALAVIGCHQSRPMPANQADYFPLAIGDEWHMDAAMVLPSGETLRGSARRVIEKTVQHDGRTYFFSRTSIELPPMAKKEYTKLVRKDADGFHTLLADDLSHPEQNEIPFPMTTGHQWSRTDRINHMQDEVIGLESVTIGDVVFPDCAHIRSRAVNLRVVEDYWEAPKVGNIRSVTSLPDGSRLIISLHEFKQADE